MQQGTTSIKARGKSEQSQKRLSTTPQGKSQQHWSTFPEGKFGKCKFDAVSLFCTSQHNKARGVSFPSCLHPSAHLSQLRSGRSWGIWGYVAQKQYWKGAGYSSLWLSIAANSAKSFWLTKISLMFTVSKTSPLCYDVWCYYVWALRAQAVGVVTQRSQ